MSPSHECNYPLHRIPIEVFEIIINFVVRDQCKCGGAACNDPGKVPLAEGYIYFDSMHQYFPPPNYRRLLTMTSICSYWRKIIIDTRALWSQIKLLALNPDLLKLWIHRSRGAPLDVSVVIPVDPTKMLIADTFLRENMNRIERISVSNYGCVQFNLPDVPAPLLKTLSIEEVRSGTALSQIGNNLYAPALEDLYLKGTTVSPSLSSFTYVRRLSLTGWDVYAKNGWSLNRILQILSHCQGTIEELEIDTTADEFPPIVPSDSILTLPRLRRLVWSARDLHPSLLEFIAAPIIQTLHVNIFFTEGSLLTVPQSFTRLSERIPTAVDVYHNDVRGAVGMNFYSNSAREDKIFALLCQWSDANTWGTSKFVKELLTVQNLLSLTHARLARSATNPEMREALEWLPGMEDIEGWVKFTV